eukprot:scaffold47451_cov140-Isochrysis_galbana.AAC.5
MSTAISAAESGGWDELGAAPAPHRSQCNHAAARQEARAVAAGEGPRATTLTVWSPVRMARRGRRAPGVSASPCAPTRSGEHGHVSRGGGGRRWFTTSI